MKWGRSRGHHCLSGARQSGRRAQRQADSRGTHRASGTEDMHGDVGVTLLPTSTPNCSSIINFFNFSS